jgi:hypothetical protein
MYKRRQFIRLSRARAATAAENHTTFSHPTRPTKNWRTIRRGIAIAFGIVFTSAPVAAASAPRLYDWHTAADFLRISITGHKAGVYAGGPLNGTALVCHGGGGGSYFRLGLGGAAAPGAKVTVNGGTVTATYTQKLPGFTQKFQLNGHLHGHTIKGSFTATKIYIAPPAEEGGECDSGVVRFTAKSL